MTQHPTWRLPAPQIRSYTQTLSALYVLLLLLLLLLLEINSGTNLYLEKISLHQPQLTINGFLNPDLS